LNKINNMYNEEMDPMVGDATDSDEEEEETDGDDDSEGITDSEF